MSVFSGLFGGNKDVVDTDKTMTDLFNNSVGPVAKEDLRNDRTIIEIRHTKPQPSENSSSSSDVKDDIQDKEEDLEDAIKVQNSKKNKKQRKAKELNEDLESKYFDKLLKTDVSENMPEKTKEEASGSGSGSDSDSDSDSDLDSDNDDEKEKTGGEKRTKTANALDLKETELEKSERTIFVGNVVSTVITSKQVYKKFKQLFSQFGKIESIRFRSISFDEALPRKVAFTQKKLHNNRDTFNAYIVFKEKEASVKATAKMNATLFENFHIRVDHVGHPAPKDNKRSIFVGNLDFEEKEETLWRYFNSKTDNDVESVRVIRDSKTNLGKGFALVQFKDTLSVNKALLLNDKPISKEKTRKLRISRAKAHSKPSIMSPNHFDNIKKTYASNKSKLAKLTDQQKTKLGRAQRVLGKADRSTAGKRKKLIIEGERAVKGSSVAGIKGLKGKKDKKPRVKKPRIRDRSTKFKEERVAMQKE